LPRSRRRPPIVLLRELFGDRTKKILRFLFDLKGRACTPEEEASE